VLSSSEEDELSSDELSSTLGEDLVSFCLRSLDALRDALLSLPFHRRRVFVCFSYTCTSLLTSPSDSEVANSKVFLSFVF